MTFSYLRIIKNCYIRHWGTWIARLIGQTMAYTKNVSIENDMSQNGDIQPKIMKGGVSLGRRTHLT